MKSTMPRIYLLDIDKEMTRAFCRHFDGIDGVETVQADFGLFMRDHPEVDGIVTPANSFGLLTGGFDKAVCAYFGEELQIAVRMKILTEWFGEQTVGTSMAVDIPGAQGKKLLHTPTMRKPSPIREHQVVYLCMRSALMEAIRAGLTCLVVPAFGGKAGQISPEVIAHNMRAAWDQIQEQMETPNVATFGTARRLLQGKPQRKDRQ